MCVLFGENQAGRLEMMKIAIAHCGFSYDVT